MELEQSPRRALSRTGSVALLAGFGLVAISLFALFSNVQVSGGFFGRWGAGRLDFGWSLLPLLIGAGWIVYRPRGLGGWALAALGVAILVLEVIGSLTFYFRPVSLVTVLLMLVPGAVGLALVAKHL